MTRRKGAAAERLAFALAACVFGFALAGSGGTYVEFSPEPPAPSVLRVCTWNVGHGVDRGGGALPDEQIAHVVGVLVRLDVDGVVLQELRDREQANRLRDELVTASRKTWVLAMSTGGSRKVALIVRGSVAPGMPISRDGRTVSNVWFSTKGGAYAIAGVHAEAFSAEERNAKIGRAVEVLEETRAKDDAYAKLLLGDLNLDLDIGARGDLFTDDRHLDVETYNFACRDLVDAGVNAGPTAEPDRRLDYVLVGGEVDVVQVGPLRDVRAPGMDHHPLLVDLRAR